MGTPFRGVTPVPFPFNLAVSLPPVLGRPVKKRAKKEKKKKKKKKRRGEKVSKRRI
jgi:hypothetical protein